LTQGSQSLTLGLILTAASQLVEASRWLQIEYDSTVIKHMNAA
jgi:hypothetical protein